MEPPAGGLEGLPGEMDARSRRELQGVFKRAVNFSYIQRLLPFPQVVSVTSADHMLRHRERYKHGRFTEILSGTPPAKVQPESCVKRAGGGAAADSVMLGLPAQRHVNRRQLPAQLYLQELEDVEHLVGALLRPQDVFRCDARVHPESLLTRTCGAVWSRAASLHLRRHVCLVCRSRDTRKVGRRISEHKRNARPEGTT